LLLQARRYHRLSIALAKYFPAGLLRGSFILRPFDIAGRGGIDMHKYDKDELHEDLQPWPFDNPASDYRILRGNPRASGRLDFGGGDAGHRLGIWACSEGAFECTELGDELQTILRGRLTLTRIDGESIDCGPGDSIFTRRGERVVWEIHQPVVKIFFSCNLGV
jgi:uncharacterized cupin superfamily protein